MEDIIDSGKSMFTLLNYLEKLKPKSMKIICLIGTKKTKFENVNCSLDYIWELKPNNYVVGYGFDDYEYYR